jgi:hypothetical protein
MESKKDICPYCGAERDYGLWYWAHCMYALTATCEKCGKKYVSRNGVNLKTTQPKKKKA